MKKTNCWEFLKCELGPGGQRTVQDGICPAATEARLDGTHRGINGGRACWVIRDTMCNGNIQSDFFSKFRDCQKCAFYLSVRSEETELVPTIFLLEMIRMTERGESGSFKGSD